MSYGVVMDMWSWALVIEYALLGAFGIYALIERARQRAAIRRLALHVLIQHPIVNTQPPTAAEIVGQDEWTTVRPE